MKKSKIVVLLLSLALLIGGGISSAQTANNNLNFDKSVLKLNEETGTAYKTVLFGKDYNSEAVGSYTESWSTTTEGFTCNIVNANNNNNDWDYIKMGTSGSITTDSAIDKAITSVTLSVSAITASKISSITLKVSNGKTFTSDSTTSILLKDKSKFVTGNMEIAVPTPEANKFYQIAIEATSIKQISISKITFNISNSDLNPVDAIGKETTKAQLKYSFNVNQEERVSSFVKVTTAPTDWSGQYLIGYEVEKENVIRVLNAGLTEEKIQLASNYFDVTNNFNNVIDYSSKLYNMTVTLTSTGDGYYTIKSTANGYYLCGGTSKTLKGINTSDTERAHTLTFDSEKIIIKDNSGDFLLQYNTAAPRFHYYGSNSNQQNVYLYKYNEQASYSFFNMKMNLGAVIEAAKVQALVDAKLSISSYGVAVAQKSNLGESTISDAVSNSSKYVSIVSQSFEGVDAMQKTDASGTATFGDYVIFNADLSFPDKSKYNVEVSAVAFFKLGDGTYVFFQERTLSVASLAKEYIANTGVYDTFDSNVKGSLKALAATTASVA